MPLLTRDIVGGLVAGGASCRMDADVVPKFKAGDKVVTRNINPASHTRLPRYVRGKRGTITHDHGIFAFPDTSADSGTHSDPQHVYSVRFEGEELWGKDANANACLYIDMFDSYLEPAES